MSFVAQLWSWLISVGRPGRAPKDQPVQRSSDGCRWGMRPTLKSRGIPNHPKPMGFNTKIVYENLEWLGGSPILGHLRICWAEVGDWNIQQNLPISCATEIPWSTVMYGHVYNVGGTWRLRQAYWVLFGLEAEHSIEMQLLGRENGVLRWKENGMNLKAKIWVVGAT